MAGTTFDEIKNDNAGAIRKYTSAFIAVAPLSADPVKTLMDATEGTKLAALPANYMPLGLIKKDDGIEFSRDTDTSDVESLGYAAPTRKDIIKDDASLKFTLQENTKMAEQLYNGIDLTSITPNETSGEVSFANPTTPATMYYRFLIVGRDGSGDQEFFKAWYIPRGQISEVDSLSFSAEDEHAYNLTLTATPDPKEKFAVKTFLGGSGFKAAAEELGWKNS